MKQIDMIKFWCYKILPLVYDDSLSYYEVLCKVQSKMNEIIENVNGIPDEIKRIISEGTIVKEAVDNYIAGSTIVGETVTQYLNEHDTITVAVNNYINSGVVENKVNEAIQQTPLIEEKVNEVLSGSGLESSIVNTIETAQIPSLTNDTVPAAITKAKEQAHIYIHWVALHNAIDVESEASSSIIRFNVISKSNTLLTKNSGANNSATAQDIFDFLDKYISRYSYANFLLKAEDPSRSYKARANAGMIRTIDSTIECVAFEENGNSGLSGYTIADKTFTLGTISNPTNSRKTYFEEYVIDLDNNRTN